MNYVKSIYAFKNFISLGFFCSVALDLERYGLRSHSYPFDWNISDFEFVINAIENNFENYFNLNYYYQGKESQNVYYNEKCKVWFFHDFDAYIPIEKQIDAVKEKYERRIHKFYEAIKEPTLFIRYISDTRNEKNECIELKYIENNIERIRDVLKKYNNNNDILYIANEGLNSNLFKIENVPIDKGDVVSRKPFDANKELTNYFNSVCYPNKNSNLEFYIKKQHTKLSIFTKIAKNLKKVYNKLFKKKFVYERVKNIY